jgi:serine/threonine protein kinase
MSASKHTELRAGSHDLIGQLAGEYRILRKLGAGGFGTVYEAEHPLLKRKAAVKVLHSSPAVHSGAVQRFIAEARSASQILHPHIVDIFSSARRLPVSTARKFTRYSSIARPTRSRSSNRSRR